MMNDIGMAPSKAHVSIWVKIISWFHVNEA